MTQLNIRMLLLNICCICANQCYFKENKQNFQAVKFTALGQVIVITCECDCDLLQF